MYILLACGSGASSGFLAQNMRKAAKKKGVEVTVKAVSDTQIEDYLKEIDILLIGPHLKHRFVEIESKVVPHGVIAMLVNQDSYAVLDGEAVLNEVLSHNK
jgi:PTS system cellobiose-specific IIB component